MYKCRAVCVYSPLSTVLRRRFVSLLESNKFMTFLLNTFSIADLQFSVVLCIISVYYTYQNVS